VSGLRGGVPPSYYRICSLEDCLCVFLFVILALADDKQLNEERVRNWVSHKTWFQQDIQDTMREEEY
jgi:hypothetical protein